jgi:tRNA A-37 threonylcarbamoyl transferase component Bud32
LAAKNANLKSEKNSGKYSKNEISLMPKDIMKKWFDINSESNYNYEFSPKSEPIKKKGISTSNNFFIKNNKDLFCQRFPKNPKNNPNNDYSYSNPKKEKSRNFKYNSFGEIYFPKNNNYSSSQAKKKIIEKYLDYYQANLDKAKRNILGEHNSNQLYIKNYLCSLRDKNLIRLNYDKIYNFLPYLNKGKDSSPQTIKELLINGNLNDIIYTDGKNADKVNNKVNVFNKRNNIKTKNKYLHLSSNHMLGSFKKSINEVNQNISKNGNNNIILNNIYNDSVKKNQNHERTYTIEKKDGTINISKDNNYKTNDLTCQKKERILKNLNLVKSEKLNKIKEIENLNNKIRTSTTSSKKRDKFEKKNKINIDCKNGSKDKKNSPEEKSIEDSKNYKLAKYDIGDVIGKGAYAIVKLITDRNTKEKYAMKIYEKSKLNSNSKKRCVYNEIRILKKLSHKNIVKLIDVINTEKEILIIQELINGISLREYYNNEIRNQKGISIHKENIFRKIFKQIFDAMDYLHKNGMAHRDIKLENILLNKDYEIKIIDFGFGMYNTDNKLEKFFCGTPNYMPPEIIDKTPYIGQLADMWSLGILVYKIFCADFPFKGKDEKELYKSIKIGKFTMAKYTPPYARKIISSLIVINPIKRISCEDVLNSQWLKGD